MPIDKSLWEAYKDDPKCCWCNEATTREYGQVAKVTGEGEEGGVREIYLIFCSAEHAEVWEVWLKGLRRSERNAYLTARFNKGQMFNES